VLDTVVDVGATDRPNVDGWVDVGVVVWGLWVFPRQTQRMDSGFSVGAASEPVTDVGDNENDPPRKSAGSMLWWVAWGPQVMGPIG
jgi:hypothetical protein